MAKKIISKSKQRDGGDGSNGRQQNGANLKQNGHKIRQNGNLPNRTFNGSENDLSLNYNSVPRLYSGQFSDGTHSVAGGGGNIISRASDIGGRDVIRYAPDGRRSPEVEMYKTRVIYHSRQDCSDIHSSV